jgi:hypothetical protein
MKNEADWSEAESRRRGEEGGYGGGEDRKYYHYQLKKIINLGRSRKEELAVCGGCVG